MAIRTPTPLRVDDFFYDLPAARIAQTPLPERDASRMLVVEHAELRDRSVRDLASELHPGDLVVANHSRVRAARLRGRRPGGGSAEILVLDRVGDDGVIGLVRPARKLPPGTVFAIADGVDIEVGAAAEGHAGARQARIRCRDGDADSAIAQYGAAPLPPYITTPLADPERYQTVFAGDTPRSAAAPTAGLHITPAVMASLRERGVEWTTVELEVGLGTFAPMTADTVDAHVMHEERFHVPEDAAAAIVAAKRRGGRVVALGTTVVRVLETAGADGTVPEGSGSSRLFIRPGHEFQVVDGLVTNFHQPRSSLLVLVATFLGGERWREVYAHALANDYRFLSFGDCMLLWPAR